MKKALSNLKMSEQEYNELFYRLADFHVEYVKVAEDESLVSKQMDLAISLATTVKLLVTLTSEKLNVCPAEVGILLSSLLTSEFCR